MYELRIIIYTLYDTNADMLLTCYNLVWLQGLLKGHTHEAIHDHADRIFDRLPVGMTVWNVRV